MKAKGIRDVTFDIRPSKEVQEHLISGGNLIAGFRAKPLLHFPTGAAIEPPGKISQFYRDRESHEAFGRNGFVPDFRRRLRDGSRQRTMERSSEGPARRQHADANRQLGQSGQ